MNIHKLLVVHAVITFAAAIVLVFFPAAIPHTADIPVNRDQYLLCYFLAASELSVAYLSYFGSKFTDGKVLRFITASLIVFHSATMVLEAYAFVAKEAGIYITGNIMLRIIIILFYYFGIYNMRDRKAV